MGCEFVDVDGNRISWDVRLVQNKTVFQQILFGKGKRTYKPSG